MIHVLGASGRLGRMLQWAWQDRRDITWHTGRADGDLLNPSQRFRNQLQEARTVVNLSGVTPAKGVDLGLNIALGTAPFALAPDALILTASSAAVYGVSSHIHTEDEALDPPSEYGLAKLQMEREINADARPNIILRIGNVAGADQLLGGLGEHTPYLHSFAGGATPERSYIGPKGLADAISGLIHARPDQSHAVNIAAGSVTMGDLLSAAGRTYDARPAPDGLPPRVTLDTRRLHSLCPDLTLAQTPQGIVDEWTAFRESRYLAP